MVYTNGTYIAWHEADGGIRSGFDRKYYPLLKTWTLKKDDDFAMLNSQAKMEAERDTAKREKLVAFLKTKISVSRHLLLIVGQETRHDTQWVPMEIGYAVDERQLPVIAAYVNYEYVLAPTYLSDLWPTALKNRIDANTAQVMHIPFQKKPLKTALHQFNPSNRPTGPLAHYSEAAFKQWGLIKKDP